MSSGCSLIRQPVRTLLKLSWFERLRSWQGFSFLIVGSWYCLNYFSVSSYMHQYFLSLVNIQITPGNVSRQLPGEKVLNSIAPKKVWTKSQLSALQQLLNHFWTIASGHRKIEPGNCCQMQWVINYFGLSLERNSTVYPFKVIQCFLDALTKCYNCISSWPNRMKS